MNISDESNKVYGYEGISVVVDGILNPLLYANATCKIMWILREPWFDFAWTMLQEKGVSRKIGNSPTLHPMVYVTYSVFNNFKKWKEMDYVRDNPEMADVLRSIAYINVKKSVGSTSSNQREIYSWFKKGEDIIKYQILEYNPDVVIGCRPFMREIFQWDKDRSAPINNEIVSYVSDKGKPLLIEAPHPSNRGKREIFVNSLIEVIEAEMGKQETKAIPKGSHVES